MTRPLRVQRKGGWYHIVNRGIDRSIIYRDDRDREHFLELLGTTTTQLCLEIHGYVLMDNHYHLIVRVPEGNLSQCMQWLNVSYSIWHNRRHNRVGPLFQGRYKSIPVEDAGWVYQLSQYVHLNPVRILGFGLDKRGRKIEGLGLRGAVNAKEATARLLALRGYRWSSYRSYGGYSNAPRWLSRQVILERTGEKEEKGQMRRYRVDLEKYVCQGYDESWAMRLRGGLAVGALEFSRAIKRGLPIIGGKCHSNGNGKRCVPLKKWLKRWKRLEGKWDVFSQSMESRA